jgi:arginyl-tRNA synthetase
MGYEVTHECYIRDAGFQSGELGETVLAQRLADMRDDLEQLGVGFDTWFCEKSLAGSGALNGALARLASADGFYTRECASDIAHHLQQRERGFSRLIDIWGTDHHGAAACIRAGLAAMGEPVDALEVQLIQPVILLREPRGPEKRPMGQRAEQLVTLRQLLVDAGNDACRFFYLMRSHEQPLDFDLVLAQARNIENPLYHVQYAHARVTSALNELRARGLSYDRAAGLAHVALLTTKEEQAVLACLTRYPEVLEQAAMQRAPHLLVHYLRELAHALHNYHHEVKWVVPEEPLRHARLALILGLQQVIRSGLALLGVPAPESM